MEIVNIYLSNWQFPRWKLTVSAHEIFGNLFLCVNHVNILKIMRTICKKVVSLQPNIHLKYVFTMARPIRETPVLKGEDAFNFEMRRLEVENRTPEERAEARRKFQEQVAEASKHIQWCW